MLHRGNYALEEMNLAAKPKLSQRFQQQNAYRPIYQHGGSWLAEKDCNSYRWSTALSPVFSWPSHTMENTSIFNPSSVYETQKILALS